MANYLLLDAVSVKMYVPNGYCIFSCTTYHFLIPLLLNSANTGVNIMIWELFKASVYLCVCICEHTEHVEAF